jgi:NAD(P)-dependent dehydrogenase (short-subunit alcohol dehydrogenase family)
MMHKDKGFPIKNDYSMQGKVCLITGATDGIGSRAAFGLARLGATVVIIGRSPEKLTKILALIQESTENGCVDGWAADLSSISEVRRVASVFERKYPRLDVLMNNAGGIFSHAQTTVDGLDMTFALNHLAYFHLTQLLLDQLKASAPARIINTSSVGHYLALPFRLTAIPREKPIVFWMAYLRSKLLNLYFTYELDRRLQGSGVTVNAIDPGIVRSNFAMNNRGWFRHAFTALVKGIGIPTEQAAQGLIYLASTPELEGISGKYFSGTQLRRSSWLSYRQDVARGLWQISEDLISVSYTGQGADARQKSV